MESSGANSFFVGIILMYTNVVIGTNGYLTGMVYTSTEVAFHMAGVTRPGVCYKPDGTCFANECSNGVDACPGKLNRK